MSCIWIHIYEYTLLTYAYQSCGLPIDKSGDSMPCGVVLLVKLLLDEGGDVLFDVVPAEHQTGQL